MMNSFAFTQSRQAIVKIFQRIPIGLAPELTAVCPGGNLIHEYPQDPSAAARFLERYSHLEVLIGADVVPVGRTEFHPWGSCYRVEARNVHRDHKQSAQLAGAALLVGEVNSTEWLSRVDHFFDRGPTALYIVFTHPTITDLERSLARLVREKLAVTVEQALNYESSVHFTVTPVPCFPAPRSLEDLAFDLGALREAA
ncbi:MAG: hypothetical protein GHCLOJNM_03240 [bacterium]|nr:hypothetical protein [bacterium]